MKLTPLPPPTTVQPKRPTADQRLPTPHLAAAEPDWRRAYQRRREEDDLQAPVPWALSSPPPPDPRPAAAEPASDWPPAQSTSAAPRIDARPAGERRREETAVDAPAQPPLPPAPWRSPPEIEVTRPAQPALASPTAQRVEALRRLGDPGPLTRVWELELPSAGPTWQLRVEQVQPLAPLNVELRVPATAQTQARQQLGELDRRLREAGHDLLRPRLRTGRSRGPVDGVKS